VVTVSGDVDMLTGPRVRDELRRCLGRRPPLLVLDFSAVTFFGTAGLGLLVEARNAATPDTAVRVVAGTRTVLRPIQIAGLDQVVAVFDDVEQALAAERHGEPQGPQ
jgi:anti-anti-sigma factor